MNRITQIFIRETCPWFNSILTRLFYWSGKIKIGSNLRVDSIPRILIDEGCELSIGNNVEFRRNIEIRVHGTAKVIIGNNVRIDRGVRILAANNATISIGDNTRIGLYSVFNGGDSIEIGKKSLISGFVYLQTSMHGFKDKSLKIQDQGFEHKPVELEEDTWLGTHVVVLPGVKIGCGAVIGSNSVVTKSVDSHTIVAGAPAKEIKSRE